MATRLPSDKELVVLRLLRERVKGMYGLEIVNASDGQLGRASIYVTLSRMEDKGFIKSYTPLSDDHPGLPRPQYKIQALGQRALQAADAAAGAMQGAFDAQGKLAMGAL
jgi:DNA-binding PadR family transcriptional regulator